MRTGDCEIFATYNRNAYSEPYKGGSRSSIRTVEIGDAITLATNVVTSTMAGASCEPDRTADYSEDLRWRMVYQRIGVGRSYREIAESLNVDQSTVMRTVALFEETEDVQKRRYPSNDGTTKLTDLGKVILLEVVISKPSIYLREVREEVKETTGIDVNESTICRFLKDSGFTRQKMKLAAQQRSELLRSQYIIDMSAYQGHPEFFIFVDEMGSDRRDRMRKFAYNLKGRPPVVEKFLFRGEHVSAITRHLWETSLSSCREVCAIPPSHQLAPLPAEFLFAEILSHVRSGCMINFTWTSHACQPTQPSSLHTSRCGTQLLDDFNL